MASPLHRLSVRCSHEKPLAFLHNFLLRPVFLQPNCIEMGDFVLNDPGQCHVTPPTIKLHRYGRPDLNGRGLYFIMCSYASSNSTKSFPRIACPGSPPFCGTRAYHGADICEATCIANHPMLPTQQSPILTFLQKAKVTWCIPTRQCCTSTLCKSLRGLTFV